MIINIIGGSGIMGKTHIPILEKAGHKVIISGRNSNPDIITATKNSDLTIISVPISKTKEIVKKVSPHAKALMDFTGLKEEPIKEMLNHSKDSCEVVGLHPLYGKTDSLKNKTIITCHTKRSSKNCDEIIEVFQKEGAKIIEMDHVKHDEIVSSISQNSRQILLNAYANLIKNHKLSAREVYELSPAPTKILITLIARQIDEKNENLYQEMIDNNPKSDEFEKELKDLISNKTNPKELRELFKDNLEEFQEKAKDLIEKL